MECRCPLGVKGRPGHCLGERGCLGSDRLPVSDRGLASEADVASPGSCNVVGPAHRSPVSPQVNAFCGQQGQEPLDYFTEKGFRALGTRLMRSYFLLVFFSMAFRHLK